MIKIIANSNSNLFCEAKHEPSGITLKTDAPKDVGGNASSFSPTDLVGTALLTCIMTTMGLVANKLEIDLTGMNGSVEKNMTATKPRRIEKLTVTLDIPVPYHEKLEHAAHNCPVHHSLHPDTIMDIQLNWKV